MNKIKKVDHLYSDDEGGVVPKDNAPQTNMAVNQTAHGVGHVGKERKEKQCKERYTCCCCEKVKAHITTTKWKEGLDIGGVDIHIDIVCVYPTQRRNWCEEDGE